MLSVLVLGIVYQPQDAAYEALAAPALADTAQAARQFWSALPHYAREVVTALAPMAALFLLFQLVTRRFLRGELLRIAGGLLYTGVGLV